MRCWNDSSSYVSDIGYGWKVLQGHQHQSSRPDDATRSDRRRTVSRSRSLRDSVSVCPIDGQHVIHTVTTIVAASTALVVVVVISVAFYGFCQ